MSNLIKIYPKTPEFQQSILRDSAVSNPRAAGLVDNGRRTIPESQIDEFVTSCKIITSVGEHTVSLWSGQWTITFPTLKRSFTSSTFVLAVILAGRGLSQ